MIYPYCKKQINENNQFCPECGQKLAVTSEAESTDTFWCTVNKEDTERYSKYKDIIDRGVKNVRDRRNKSMVTVVILLVAVIAAIFGIMQFSKYQNEMTEKVMSELVGQTFTAHDSHMEGLGWVHHEYWQLTFKDEKNLITLILKQLDRVRMMKSRYIRGPTAIPFRDLFLEIIPLGLMVLHISSM